MAELATKKMEKVFDLSVKELEEALSNKKPITDKTKLASQAIGRYSGLMANENNRASITHRMCKDFAKDPKELRKLIRSTAPTLNVKQLER